MCMRHIVICGLPHSTKLAFYFHILTTMHGQNHIKLVWIIGNPEEILTAVQVCTVCGKVLRRLSAAPRLTIIIVWQDFFLNMSPCCERHSGRFISHEF